MATKLSSVVLPSQAGAFTASVPQFAAFQGVRLTGATARLYFIYDTTQPTENRAFFQAIEGVTDITGYEAMPVVGSWTDGALAGRILIDANT